MLTNTVLDMASTIKTIQASKTFLALLRAHEQLVGRMAALIKDHGLTMATYNAIRILRGAGPEGLPCHAVGERLINRVPDVTRLLDRMERDGLVRRQRSEQDRRVVLAVLTPEGWRRAEGLDQPVLDLNAAQFEDFTEAEIDALRSALERLSALAPAVD